MNDEKNIVEVLEERGRIDLTDLASLFLPSPPIRCWEEDFDGEECEEDCDDCEEEEEFEGEERKECKDWD